MSWFLNPSLSHSLALPFPRQAWAALPASAAPVLCPRSSRHGGSNLLLYCFISHSFLDQMPAGVLCAQQWGTRDETGAGPRRALEQCALLLREEVAHSRAGAPPTTFSYRGTEILVIVR